jgi:uncharacterized membrane protein YkvA (DUF1232 family)
MDARTPDLEAERLLADWTKRMDPRAPERIDAQFADKLVRIQEGGHAPEGMIDQLRVLWELLRAPDDVVPMTAKGWIMAALTYVVSPVDLIPDGLGGAGLLDDAQVVRLVYGRLGPEIAAYHAHRQGKPG